MIKIRLARSGVKNDPFYRIVAINAPAKTSGKPLAILGHWHPRKSVIKIDKKAVTEWVTKGAQISASVSKLLSK